MTEESERYAIWQQNAKRFLLDKSATELFDLTVLILTAVEDGAGTSTYGVFEHALHEFLEDRTELAIELAQLMLASSDYVVRKEAYWLAERIAYSEQEAAKIIWALLDDSSDQVSSSVLSLYEDWFKDAGINAPLSVITEAAAHLADAKHRHQP
jgi:hypothetical protein